MTYEEIYNKKLDQFAHGEITETEWTEFCTSLLDLILENNEDILKRLKSEW